LGGRFGVLAYEPVRVACVGGGQYGVCQTKRHLTLLGDREAVVPQAVEPVGRFPRLRASLDTSAAEYAATPQDTFRFGLQAILHGLEAHLTGGRTPAHQNPGEPPGHDRESRATSPAKS
jgi:hypothetical protein